MDDNARPRPIRSDADWEREGWAEEAEPLTASPKLGAMISVRLDPEAARTVRRAARAEGLTQSAFVRRAALRAATEAIGREPAVIAAPAGEAPLIVWGGGRTTFARDARTTGSTGVNVEATSGGNGLLPGPPAGRPRPDGQPGPTRQTDGAEGGEGERTPLGETEAATAISGQRG